MRRFTGLAASAALGVVLLGGILRARRRPRTSPSRCGPGPTDPAPCASGNIVAAGEQLNAMLAASGSSTRVKVDVYEDNADGLRRRRAGPPQGVRGRTRAPTSTWPRTSGSASSPAIRLRHGPGQDFVDDNPWAFGDVIPVLWNATKYRGQDLRDPAGLRDPHVLLQQGHAAEDRQGRGVHRGPARPRSTRASSRSTDLWQARQGGGRQGGGARSASAAPAQCRARLSDELRRLRREVHGPARPASCCCPRRPMQQALEWFDWKRARTASRRRTTRRCPGTRSRAPSRPRRPSSIIRASGR